MPKSHLLIPVLQVAGELSSEKSLLQVAYYAELLFKPFTHEAIVIDLEKADADDAAKIALTQLAGKHYRNVLCVGVPPVAGDDRITSHTAMRKAQEAIVSLLRKERFDGGKVLPDPASLNYLVSKIPSENYSIRIGCTEALYNDKRLLLITVTGRYPVGSMGSEDGRLLQLQLEYAFRINRPDRLIVDMTTLDYTWGDEWTYAPFDVQRDKSFPFRLVISEGQDEHMRPLMGEETRVARSVQQAIEELS